MSSSLRTWLPHPIEPSRGDLQLVAKMLAAGTLAWWLCTLLGAPRPLFAVLVPLVAMSGDPFSSLNISISRTLGVFAGVFIGIALLQENLPSTVLVALLLALSLAAGLVLRVRGSPVNNQVAITAMFMLYLGAATKAETVGVARIWETALGAAVAFTVSALVWPPDPLGEAKRRVARLSAWLAADLQAVTVQLARPDVDQADDLLELVRERSLQSIKDVLAVEQAERGLRWNPHRRRDEQAFAAERSRLTGAARQYRHLRNLARSVTELAEQRQPLPPVELDRLVKAVTLLSGSRDETQTVPETVAIGALHDPRAIGIGLKLVQMSEDVVVPPPASIA